MKNKTLVVVTSALFAGGKGEVLTEPSAYRLARLERSIEAARATGFSHFILLDNTLPATFNVDTLPIPAASLTAKAMHLPSDEFQRNGPSRLEAVLLGQAKADLEERLKDFNFVLKISAGYKVKNLGNILLKASGGVVFRMGNPFRKEIKFCLSSFYILPSKHFLNLAEYFMSKLPDMSNFKPLEYHLYQYVQSVEHKLISIPYPRLDADFLSSNHSSNDLNYRLKEQVFIGLAKVGLYAYVVK